MSTISRRAFLKTVGVGALSVAAVSVLAGCDKLPGTVTPETPTTVGALEATAGVSYSLAGFGTVKVEAPAPVTASNTFVKLSDAIKGEYVKAFRGVFTNVAEYNTALEDDSALINLAVDEGTKAANDYLAKADTKKAWILKSKITLDSILEDEVVLGTTQPIDSTSFDRTPAAFSSNTTVFTATCDGTAVDCAINVLKAVDKDTAGNDTSTTDGKTEVNCYIEATPNFKELVLTVAIPGAARALKYTIKNENQVDYTKIDVRAAITNATVSAWS